MKKFEYKGVYIRKITELDDFNEAGSEGWELISILPAYSNGYKGIFKREIIEEDSTKITLND